MTVRMLYISRKWHGLAGLDVGILEEHQADQCQRCARDADGIIQDTEGGE